MKIMTLFDHLKIAKKLTVGFGAVVVIVLVLGVAGYRGIHSLEKAINNLVDNRIPDLQSLAALNRERMVIRAQTLEVLLQKHSSSAVPVYQRIIANRRKSWEAVDRAWERFNATPRHDDRGRLLVEQLGNEYRAWRAIYVELDRTIGQLAASSNDTKQHESLHREYATLVERMIPLSDAMGNTFDLLTENNTLNTGIIAQRYIREAQTLETTMVIVALIGLALAVVTALLISRSISTPLVACSALLKKISSGDLSITIDDALLKRGDENGDLARSMHEMVVNLGTTLRTIAGVSTTLDAASEELVMYTSELNSATVNVSEKSSIVAAAAEEATSTVTNISAATEEMSTSVSTVATAIEEMSASLNEVAKNCQKESLVAAKANEQARSTRETMDRLGAAAKAIGKVVEVISDIADQTNLLALNAAIEAASAGAAGKGFSVVANEVKELAKQTAQSTREIGSQIEAMQTNTESAVTAIDSITGVIEEINTISQTIVSAVEEQSATINEIAGSMSGASTAATEIARNVAETALGLTEVSSNIQEISGGAADLVDKYGAIGNNAATLKQSSGEMKRIVGQFNVS